MVNTPILSALELGGVVSRQYKGDNHLMNLFFLRSMYEKNHFGANCFFIVCGSFTRSRMGNLHYI